MTGERKREGQVIDLEVFKEDLQAIKAGRGMLMQALHMAQNRFGHIPVPVQETIAETLKVPLSTVYGVITFYTRFTLLPRGKCEISICMGTACYIQGAAEILKEAERLLGVEAGGTTADGLFSLTTTRCAGACGLAPVVTVNGEVHGRMNLKKMRDLLTDLQGQYGQAEADDDHDH